MVRKIHRFIKLALVGGWIALRLVVLCSMRESEWMVTDFQELVTHGADTEQRDEDGCTAMHKACSQGNVEVVKYLLEMDARADAIDFSGAQPLHYASLFGQKGAVGVLLNERIVNINAIDSQGWSALHKA
jgi:ankyrin repeat protein